MLINEKQDALNQLVKRLEASRQKPKEKVVSTRESVYSDREVIDKMLLCSNGPAIRRLLDGDYSGYGSQSEADLALCNHLAFWTDCNAGQMDALFHSCGLLRDKWDQKHFSDGRTYGEATIQKAIEGCTAKRRVRPEDFAADDPFSKFALNGQAETMKKKMLEDKVILADLAILGQFTIFYAKPNVGKTLLVMWLILKGIQDGMLKGDNIIIINADDTHKGLTTKLELVEESGAKMLAPGYNGFKADMLTPMLLRTIETETASGKIIVLDTIKKFTNIMDKTVASKFAEVVRQFVSHGGSVIGLAHTNKHRGDDGKVIYAGTSDLVDDADCAYTLDIVTDDKFTGMRVVKFENLKNRGDVALEASYEYNAGRYLSYEDRLSSVRCLDDKEIEEADRYRQREKLFRQNAEIISEAKQLLSNGPLNQKALMDAIQGNTAIGRRAILSALKSHTGEDEKDFCFWVTERRARNELVYIINEV